MPNISRSKRNQTLKFGQVKDHNKRNNFLQRNNYSTSSKIYITSVYAVQGQLELFQMLNTFLVIIKCTRLCTDKVYGLLSVLSAYCKNLKSKFWSCFSVVFFCTPSISYGKITLSVKNLLHRQYLQAKCKSLCLLELLHFSRNNFSSFKEGIAMRYEHK